MSTGWRVGAKARGFDSVIMLAVMIAEPGCRISRLSFRGNRDSMIAEAGRHRLVWLMPVRTGITAPGRR